MAEYTELLSDYFTGSRQNDANKKQQALEKIIETLEHETEQEWNSVLSEDLHALTPPDNDIEKVIELFNDMTEYLEMNESKFFTVEVPYNRVLYRYQKDHLNNFELHFSKLSEKNKYLLLLNYETTVEYRLAQMQQIQFKPETWDNLYWHYSVQTYDSAVSKEAMMSFLETKASKSVIATQAADKELTEGTWTQESLNQYIQAGADLRALRASAALYAQIKAFELLSEGFTKEELAQDVENIVSNYWFSTKADPEFKFLKYLIENKYSFATTFSESNMWLGARGRTPLMWSLTALDEKFFNFLMAQNIDLNINYIHSETQESVLSLVLMRAKENIFQIDKMKRLIEKGATITENLQSDFVEILFLDNEIDYIRDLANSGKISYANIFNLIYKEPTALTATYILSFIRKNNPDFKLTEEEAQRALSHLIKSENRNVIEMLLQMGANPATLSKEDMMSFVRKAYHFETYAEERANDLNNGRMFRVVEELFVNDQIPLTSVFDIIFHSFEKKQANVSSYLLILIQKHHEKFQLSDADAAQFFTELMLQKHTIGDSLVSQFVFFGVAKYLIQNRLNAIQLNKDEAQLLALLAIKNKNSELISEFVKNKKLSLNELFSYIDNVEAADNEDFILNTVLEIDPKFIPTSDLFYQAFVRFTVVGDVDSIKRLKNMGIDFSPKIALELMLSKELPTSIILNFIKEHKVDMKTLQPASLEILIGKVFVQDTMFDEIGGWDSGFSDEESDEENNERLDREIQNKLKAELLSLRNNASINSEIFVLAALKQISKGNLATGSNILSTFSLRKKDLDLTDEQRKKLLETLPQYCEKILSASENPNSVGIDEIYDLIARLIKTDNSLLPTNMETIKIIAKLSLKLKVAELLDLMIKRGLITYDDILNLIDESDKELSDNIILYFRENRINFRPAMNAGQRALKYCINKKDRDNIEFLINAGVNPAHQDSESLKTAILSKKPSFQIINVLLDNGANPKARAFEFILAAIDLADKYHWPDLNARNVNNNLAIRNFYLNVAARLLILSFPDLKEAIIDTFSKENEHDDRPNANTAAVLNLIESTLDPVQSEAFELVKLRRELQKEQAEYAGDDSLCRKANEHFAKVVEPHLRHAFEVTPGDTNLEKVESLEKKIKALILDRIVFVNQDERDPHTQALVRFVQENRAALIEGRNESINTRMRELAISKTDNAQFAWRAYDPKAPHDPEFENLLTQQTSLRSIHSTQAARGTADEMTALRASETCRLRVAYYFLALESGEIDVDNFFQQLADIRHAHPDPENPNGVDSPSCFPGTIGRIGKMGAGNEKLQLPPDRQEIIREAINTMVMKLYGDKIMGLERDEALKLYNSLVNMSMKNAVEIVDGTMTDYLRYKPKMLARRRQFLDELGSESEKFTQINAKLIENKEPEIFYKDFNFIKRQFSDIGAGRSNELYDRIPSVKAEPVVEVMESAQVEVKPTEITNPFSVSARLVSTMKSLPMRAAYVDKQLRSFIEFELLSNAISDHVNIISNDELEKFTKALVENIANPDLEKLDKRLNKAFDKVLAMHHEDFSPELKNALINHREAILAQSLFKGLNEERIEKINEILKQKVKVSDDSTFNDLIDSRFKQLQNKLPVYPSKKGKEPESSSDRKGKKRM